MQPRTLFRYALLAAGLMVAAPVAAAPLVFSKDDEAALEIVETNQAETLDSARSVGDVSLGTAWVELDGQGPQDLVVVIDSPSFCLAGGSCPVLVLLGDENGDYREVLTIFAKTAEVLDSSTNGKRDLLIDGQVTVTWGEDSYMD